MYSPEKALSGASKFWLPRINRVFILAWHGRVPCLLQLFLTILEMLRVFSGFSMTISVVMCPSTASLISSSVQLMFASLMRNQLSAYQPIRNQTYFFPNKRSLYTCHRSQRRNKRRWTRKQRKPHIPAEVTHTLPQYRKGPIEYIQVGGRKHHEIGYALRTGKLQSRARTQQLPRMRHWTVHQISAILPPANANFPEWEAEWSFYLWGGI